MPWWMPKGFDVLKREQTGKLVRLFSVAMAIVQTADYVVT